MGKFSLQCLEKEILNPPLQPKDKKYRLLQKPLYVTNHCHTKASWSLECLKLYQQTALPTVCLAWIHNFIPLMIIVIKLNSICGMSFVYCLTIYSLLNFILTVDIKKWKQYLGRHFLLSQYKGDSRFGEEIMCWSKSKRLDPRPITKQSLLGD